jgi:hypothetical protein
MILNRHVFFIAGFDPFDVAAMHRRFRREAATFQRTWNVSATVSDLASQPVEHWVVAASGPNWSTRTTYEPLAWHDIVLADLAGPMLPRLQAGAETFWDFLASGTVFRYFRANYRYALFFLLPFADVLLFVLLALAGAWLIATNVPLHPGVALVLGIVIAPALFALLLRWPGRRWRVSQGLADWITPRDYIYGRRPDIDARIDAFAQRLLACARRTDVDEIMLVGHSLGAIFAVDVLSRALAANPQLGRNGPPVSFMTIGATVPKLTLHPAAVRLRGCAEKVAAAEQITWGEYQTRQDPISFYYFDPVRLKPFKTNSGQKPHIRIINFWDLVEPAKMKRIAWKFMRIHYQFVMAAERRGTYDLFMLICGPAPFSRAIWASGGCAELFAQDGAYLEERSEAPARKLATDV